MESPCKCDHLTLETLPDKAAQYKELYERRKLIVNCVNGYSIEDFQKLIFLEIYGGKNYLQSLENIGFHFLEEMGEAAVCVRELSQLRGIARAGAIELDFLHELSNIKGIVNNYVRYKDLIKKIRGRLTPEESKDIFTSKDSEILKARLVKAKMGLVIEIGDSFSWFCSILNKLDIISKFIFDKPEDHPDFIKPLEELLNNEYIDAEGKPKCPTCGCNPCECVFYNIEI